MIYLGKNAVGVSDTVQVVSEDIVNRVNAVEIKETVSTPSNIMTIYDGADNVPVDEIVVGIELSQSGFDDPSPDNIRPFFGNSSISIFQTGKNYLNNTGISKTHNGISYTVNEDKTVTANGTATSSSTLSINDMVALPIGQYILKGCPEGGASSGKYRLRLGYANDNTFIGNDIGNGYSFSVTGNDIYNVKILIEDTSQAINKTFTPMIVSASEPDISYELYANKTVSNALPVTCYGGKLILHKDGTGTLVVDTGVCMISDFSWTNTDAYGRFISDIVANVPDSARTDYIVSSCYVGKWNGETFDSNWDKVIYLASSRFVVHDSNYTTVEAFLNAVGNETIAYGLVNPIQYELSNLEVLKTLKGTNHIQSNTGDILSLTYSADPKMYVDQNKGVSDVKVNGTSVVTDGVANVPLASASNSGTVLIDGSGLQMALKNGSLSQLKLYPSDANAVKDGVNYWRPIVPQYQHQSAFYGLAKAAGDTTQSASSNTVGTYTETAKSKISDMLSSPVTVSGTTPSITALPGVRYICGECSTLSITVPESGIIDVTFTSGSTATVLTVTPPTGMTMHWANGFDPTSLDADTVYEINIMDGCYGVVGTWT